jgi:TRAP transporter TAXI family solute receptor
VWDFVKIYVPIAAVVAAGFWAAWQFADPAPPRTLRMATGAPDGAYAAFGERYRNILAREGVRLELVPTSGSIENIALLRRMTGGVEVAFVQGGTGDPATAPGLVSLASVFLEPVWLFARAAAKAERLANRKGARIATGVEGSGTRALALRLLEATGLEAGNSDLRSIGGPVAAAALRAGEIDAAFFVTAQPSEAMRALLADPSITLVAFPDAEAFARRFAFLERIDVPQGLIDLERDIPPAAVTMLAPAASLVARGDIHPALITLLLDAATEIHGPAGLFHSAGQFPSARYVDYPLDEDAQRYLKSGPTFLRRFLPFGIANLTERLVILLVPLLGLLIPLFRIAPPAYRWQIRRKITRWYEDLRSLEDDARAAGDRADHAELVRKLDALQAEVGQVKVPLGYADSLYHLRLHIELAREIAARAAGR